MSQGINWIAVDEIINRANTAVADTAAWAQEGRDGLVLVYLDTPIADLDDDGNCDASTAVFRMLKGAGLDVRDDAASHALCDGSETYRHVFALYDQVA